MTTKSLELQNLPEEILINVLSFVPAFDLVMNCNHVCRHWWTIVMGQTLWRMKCENERLPFSTEELASSDVMVLYFNSQFGLNLIINPVAKDGLNGWDVKTEGGHGFLIETKPAGSDPIEKFVSVRDINFWTTSCGWCRKSQLIDLKNMGITQEILEKISPDIRVSEWYAARFDCGCKYSLKVLLRSEDLTLIDKFHFEDRLPAGRDWHHVEHTFRGYHPGVQFIEYKHKGIDTKFWSGHYGAKMTLSSVTLDFGNMRQNLCDTEPQRRYAEIPPQLKTEAGKPVFFNSSESLYSMVSLSYNSSSPHSN